MSTVKPLNLICDRCWSFSNFAVFGTNAYAVFLDKLGRRTSY
ncbi:hypothetical protein [Gloeocapsa sp. PCC 7428]|nr:hypothetical protein [Gloeocapsa sp. PCC 7428]